MPQCLLFAIAGVAVFANRSIFPPDLKVRRVACRRVVANDFGELVYLGAIFNVGPRRIHFDKPRAIQTVAIIGIERNRVGRTVGYDCLPTARNGG